ncbi:sterol-4alpha-carboxylate 3-dehydrogenase (decarboxylating) [Geosmithia morbida]|uniref:Sterol-4-alpha-carboxylate 3-dehydrogenase ERG26, decarboxylating n=1 Tax=Geosmithia morbida TaxID=1094350 RepID=A0A9P4YVM6_9HYPO|nr:sterol-4alpha-carboxylate 3-dehydrogenase (decarboxylating) [Geosmithia morbida]KAF4122546.1 sterol-4alpha-carboxylate 3-dehydrogenase (decarboxylating) [Geosmithia morbida]
MATKLKAGGDLGRVIVVGGNGFLGSHIVNQALGDSDSTASWTATSVASVDLRCERNRNERATYHECDITDVDKLTSIFEELKPDVVIHTASPVAADSSVSHDLFRKVNIDGTLAVIRASQQSGAKALVYTSSASVISDDKNDLINADERWPVIRGSQQGSYYSETKAAAEEDVLKANRQEPYKLLTCAIRPAGIFGEADVQTLAGFMNTYKNGRHKVQLGDNENIFDFTYVGNVAHAHLLAARLLLATAASPTAPLDHERVDGEAFFVTNDSPVYFWDFARSIYAAAGDRSGTDGLWRLPADFAFLLAFLSETFSWITRRTPTFGRKAVTMSTMTRYYNISKARRVLHYEPVWTLREGVERGVKWFLDRDARDAAAVAEK